MISNMTMIDRYTPGHPLRELWDSLPQGEFIHVSKLASFGFRHDTILMKIQTTVPSVAIQDRQLGELPFGKVHALTCANLVVAYQITIPACKMLRVGTNYCAFARKTTVEPDVETYLADRKIAIVGNSDALLAVSNTTHWTVR